MRYYGKYRATVVNNNDPFKLGRVEVTVDKLCGDRPRWAMPSVPFAGPQAGLFVLPPEKARVWVEFEEGDLCNPIWSGGFWDDKTVPSEALDPKPPTPHILLQTTGKNAIHLCDGAAKPLTAAGGIVLKSGSSTIVIRPDGITISANKIEIKGLTTINDGALTVQK